LTEKENDPMTLKNSIGKDHFREKAIRTHVMLAALALSGLVSAGCGSGESATPPAPAALTKKAVSPAPPAPVPAPPTPVPAPPAPAAAPPPPGAFGAERKPASPAVTWAAVVTRMEQSDREADCAAAARVAQLDAFFAERKRGARPFAEEILGVWHKLAHADALAGRGIAQAGKAISGLFKTEEELRRDELAWPLPGESDDPYTYKTWLVFERLVMKGTDFKAATESAATAFVRDLQGLEARLLVDLRADLADDELGRPAPAATDHSVGVVAVDAALADVLSVARTDLGVTIAQESLSFVVGNKVGDVFARGATAGLGKLALNITGNLAVDQALGKARERAGYDAEADVAARVVRTLDGIRNRLVEGDPQAVKAYQALRAWRRGHPDPAVRIVCREATDAIEHSGGLGLKQSLRAVHDRRAEVRRAALSRLILGSDAGVQAIDPQTMSSSDQILNYAQQCAAFWKGKKS
jgi:hypothetical protein